MAKYKGNRYVPILAGIWDSNKEYEPLTIVTWQGNSYTSKVFVPNNVEITNRIYWECTGNYNAQIEQYRREVSELRDIVNGILNS